MKKKVVIEKVPSSKKKVVIEGLPKADIGKRMAENKANRMQSAWDKDIAQYPNSIAYPNQQDSVERDAQGYPVSKRPNEFSMFDWKDTRSNIGQYGEDNAYYSGTDPYVENPKYSDSKPVKNKKGLKNKKNVNWDFSNSNFGLFPLSGGKYAQRGFNYLNQIPGQVENAVSIFKTGKPTEKKQYPIYNPYVNAYWNYAEGGYLPKAQWGDEWGTSPGFGATQQSYSSAPENLQPVNVPMADYQTEQNATITPSAPQITEGMQQINLGQSPDYSNYKSKKQKALETIQKVGAVAAPINSALAAGYNFTKQGLSDVGSNIANRKAQQAENQLYTQSVFSDAMNVTPYEEQGYGFTGRNALAADGMQIKQIGGMGEPNVEVEGEEHIQLPNGFSQEIQGKKHSEGGIPINLPQGTKIFSEKLKVPVSFLKEAIALDPENQMLKSLKLPKTGKVSYADLAKKFETKKYVDLLNSKDADAIQMTTAQLMIQQNNAKLEELFGLQEQNKISGVHGPQVQQNAQQEQQEQEAQQAQQAQMQGEQMEQPMMKYGGLYKAQVGSKVYSANDNYTSNEMINGKPKSVENFQSRSFIQNPDNNSYSSIGNKVINGKPKSSEFFYNTSIPESFTVFDKGEYKFPKTNTSEGYDLLRENIKNISNAGAPVGYGPGFKYGGYHLPMYENAGKTGKKIVGVPELNKSGTKVRITYSDGTTEFHPWISQRPPQNTYQSTKPTWAIQNQVPAINVPATPSTNKQAPKTTTKAKTAQVSNVPSGYREGIWSGDKFVSQNPIVQIPFAPETSRTWNAMTDFKSVKDYADAVGYTEPLDPKDIQGTNLKIQEFVGKNYPELVEKYHSGYSYGIPAAKTPYDSKLGVRWQAIGKEIQNLRKKPAVETTVTKEPEKEPEQKPGTPPAPQVVNQTYEVPGLNLGIALPNVYERMPLNYYKIEPEYIDPRYLDIQPQLNRIGRGQRAIESTLGSRGSSDMANLLQAQANRAAAEQEAYGQKYNYDRAQDAAAQQFNAQAKMNTNQYNQQSWFQQLEDPIRRRESLIGTQQMMDDQAAIENARKMQAFYGNKDFIGDTFYPSQNMTMQDVLANLKPANLKQYIAEVVKESKGKTEEDETTEVKKYGGKIKKKIKIKPKIKNSYF